MNLDKYASLVSNTSISAAYKEVPPTGSPVVTEANDPLLETWMIAVIAVGAVLVLIILIVILVVCLKRYVFSIVLTL